MTIDPTTGLGPESYRLEVSSVGIDLVGGDAAGQFYATQTLRQLLPPAAFRAAPIADVAWAVLAVSIEDGPRFGWRGGLLDVGRYFLEALEGLGSFHRRSSKIDLEPAG